jgi:putative sterol carrier protein
MEAAMAADSSLATKVKGVLQFELGEESWTVDCSGDGRVSPGKAAKADCTVTMKEKDFLELFAGKLNGMSAYMSGKMKVLFFCALCRPLLHHHQALSPVHQPQIKGNMGMAQKLAGLTEAARKRPAAAPAAAAAPSADAAESAATTPAEPAEAKADAAAPEGFKSNAVFQVMASNLESQPGLASKVNGSFAFIVTDGPAGASASWSVVAKGASPGVTPFAPAKADCSITISDQNLVALAAGKMTGMSAYMSGKMKIKGNMGLAQKLAVLMTAGPRSKM